MKRNKNHYNHSEPAAHQDHNKSKNKTKQKNL